MNRNVAFTLIEILVAIMILSLTLITLSTSEGQVMNSSRRARLITIAVVAAKNLMAEIDMNYQAEGFGYIEKLGKKEEKDFKDEPYQGWKWMREVREVKFPIGEILKSLSARATDSETVSNPDSIQADAFIGLLSANLDKVMKDTVKEVSVTVYWPIRGGSSFSSYTLVYYVVDYEKANMFVPSL